MKKCIKCLEKANYKTELSYTEKLDTGATSTRSAIEKRIDLSDMTIVSVDNYSRVTFYLFCQNCETEIIGGKSLESCDGCDNCGSDEAKLKNYSYDSGSVNMSLECSTCEERFNRLTRPVSGIEKILSIVKKRRHMDD